MNEYIGLRIVTGLLYATIYPFLNYRTVSGEEIFEILILFILISVEYFPNVHYTKTSKHLYIDHGIGQIFIYLTYLCY